MIWIDDEDAFSILAYLLEAKGSIGAMMDLADEKHASALLEDHRRICCAIDMLYDIIKKEKNRELVKRVSEALEKMVAEHAKETQ